MKFGHWLCLLLADAADTIDVDTVAGVAGDIFADALIRVGVPGWAASVIGWGVSNAAQKTLVHVMPGAQLCLGLRVLGVLVCPKPEKCPASDQLAGPLLKALLAETESN